MRHRTLGGGDGADWVTDRWAVTGLAAEDPSRPFGYLLSPRREQYAGIMAVLERSVDQLTPSEVASALAAEGLDLPLAVVVQRLRALSETFLAASGRPDSDIERWQELNGARWRYSATPRGRQVQRLWAQMVAEGLVQREIPVDGLSRIREVLTGMARDGLSEAELAKMAGQVFVEHDHLDAALVGQADVLAQLADRFDLDARAAAELKQLIVEYATHVVAHLDRAVALIHDQLLRLRPRFGEFAATRQRQSPAAQLVARGVLAPTRGVDVADWERLLGWFSPGKGKAARFGLQLVRAIPMMHANLRRHQAVVGPQTLRAKALSLAVACQGPRYGTAVLRASLSDHPWSKLHTVAEGEDGEVVSWHDGPRVPALAMLRATGQSGPRGKAARRRPREEAAREIAELRAVRESERWAAVAEVLAGGGPLSERACRAALRAVVAAVRAQDSEHSDGSRTGQADGLGCTLTMAQGMVGRVEGVRWSVLVPGRRIAFHPPAVAASSGRAPSLPSSTRDRRGVAVVVEAAR
ncbi:DUF2397 family protein [Streptomyces chromofuscus]|uniref:DUF2397 family protein n=1 Tax=Streptomyces chromofuscus TaxID=42881 RepID=UPI0016737D30|nr:DUF2397 family protein [Streptomyces chromofuscus]GGT44402.1 hypothetical protein GCM10010254_74410 [Streptomyces chromofuscus]